MALQNLCIDVIISNFEEYFPKFSITEDAGLKRKLEFLQRKFSYEITTQLYKKLGRLETEYIDFLINRHLRVLEFDWLKECSWDEIIAKFKEVGPGLQKVCFSDGYYYKPMHHLMSYLPNLEVMTFHRCCTNKILKGLAEFCDNILEIDITGSESVTNKGIKHLVFKESGAKSCLKLRKLLIDWSSVTEEGVAYVMKHMPFIEIIGFHSLPDVLYSTHKKDLPLINNIKPYNLQNLNLVHFSLMPHFTDLLKICLSVCPHLKSLLCPIQKQEHLNMLSKLSALEELYLQIGSETEDSMSEIEINEMLELNGKKLYSLTVNSLSLSVLALSKSCPILKYLHLIGVDFNMDSLSSPVFPCLETCILDSIICDRLSGKSLSLLLQSSPKLDYIAFKNCSLTNEIRIEILKCCEQKSIKKIDFSGSVFEMNFIRDILCNCPSLTSITLDDCGLNFEEEIELDEIAQSLPNNPKLHFGDDRSTSLSDEFVYDIYAFEDNYSDFINNYYADNDDDETEDDYGFFF